MNLLNGKPMGNRVTVDVTGLTAGTRYYYQFQDAATLRQSTLGRTVTAPDSSTDSVTSS